MKKRCSVVVAVILLAGCGLEDYESRMATRLAVLQEQTRYEALYAPAQIKHGVEEDAVAYPITIRLPRMFGLNDWFTAKGGYRYREGAVAEDVLYPPFLGEFPGFNRVGEAYGEPDERSTIAYYCYLGVLESRSAKFDAVLSDLRKKTAAKLPDTSPWQDVECRDENLVATTWKMMEAKGKQTFPDRSAIVHTMEGTFRAYAREDQGYIVLWAVRVPDSISHVVPLLDLADAVAGTVKITEPAPTGPVPTGPVAAPAEPPDQANDANPADEAASPPQS
ncbi:MAG: hypothetical protein WD875_02380 [Pirellulales bacterium]